MLCEQCGERPVAHRYRRCSRCRRKPYPRGEIPSRRIRDTDALRERDRRYRLAGYGLTPEQYDAILAEQDGRCAICGRTPEQAARGRRLCVDHDHSTGAVRALLCVPCNSGIGQLGDDPDLLRRAADYLERFRGNVLIGT